jgi:chitinase
MTRDRSHFHSPFDLGSAIVGSGRDRSLPLCVAVVIFIFLTLPSFAQLPSPALIGYFHNWNNISAPYIQLDQVDPRYNTVIVAFAIPESGSDYKMSFRPSQTTQAAFTAQIQSMQNQGRKVLISAGGGADPVVLNTAAKRDTFVVRMTKIIEDYGFDGMDIDFEGSSLSVSGGTIAAPIDSTVINLIDAVKRIMARFYDTHGRRMILTMAPETAFVQGGMSAYNSVWGAYLPVIHALRDSIEVLQVQLYNSGSMFGIDGRVYSQGTADFIVAMSEAVIRGFGTAGGNFAGLPAHKIAVGLPACISAASNGYTDTAIVEQAVDYLRGKGLRPGSYVLSQAGGYPDLRGMMTWSINWDASTVCGGVYEYAANFERMFGSSTEAVIADGESAKIEVYPNPAGDRLNVFLLREHYGPVTIRLYDYFGRLVLSRNVGDGENITLNLSELSAGIFCLRWESSGRFIMHIR